MPIINTKGFENCMMNSLHKPGCGSDVLYGESLAGKDVGVGKVVKCGEAGGKVDEVLPGVGGIGEGTAALALCALGGHRGAAPIGEQPIRLDNPEGRGPYYGVGGGVGNADGCDARGAEEVAA